jgi:hypothetical protein
VVVGVAVAVAVAVVEAVAVGVAETVTVAVAVAVGVGLVPPGQLPLTLYTMCMFGKPISPTGVGSFIPQATALR